MSFKVYTTQEKSLAVRHVIKCLFLFFLKEEDFILLILTSLRCDNAGMIFICRIRNFSLTLHRVQ